MSEGPGTALCEERSLLGISGLYYCSTPRIPQPLHRPHECPRVLLRPLFPPSSEQRDLSVLALEALELRGLQPAEDARVGRRQLRCEEVAGDVVDQALDEVGGGILLP